MEESQVGVSCPCLDLRTILLWNIRVLIAWENLTLKTIWGFPGGAGGHRFEPWSGKIPHATEQLSLCATTTDP